MQEVFGTPEEIAARLRREVRREVGLPITVGVACTKFLAKVASAVAKPDGLLWCLREASSPSSIPSPSSASGVSAPSPRESSAPRA